MQSSPNTKITIFVISFCFFASCICFAQEGINTITQNSTLEVNGSLVRKVITVTNDLTLEDSNGIVICNNESAPRTITLPK